MKRYIWVISILISIFLCACEQPEEKPVVEAGPIAHYSLDKSLSDTFEKHNLIPYGDMSFNIGGLSGNSLFLNGGYLTIGNCEKLNLFTDFTYSTWININDFTSYNPILFGNESRAGDIAGGPVSIYFNDRYTTLQCDLTFETYNKEYISHSFIAKNVTNRDILKKQWRHIAVTLEGTVLKMYLDGNKIYDQALPDDFGKFKSIAMNSKPYTIGRSIYSNFNGSFDDILLYNYALSEERIKNIYNDKLSSYKNLVTFKKDSTDIVVNLQTVPLSAPITENYDGGIVIVPVKTFCDAIGATCEWFEKDGLGRFDIKHNNHSSSFWILNSNASINGMHTKIDPYPKMIDDTAYVSLTVFAESIGGIILYNPAIETYNLYF